MSIPELSDKDRMWYILKGYVITESQYGHWREWFLNGKRHREDGPAAERSDGSREWFLDGKLHREDGPAIEWADGTRQWCINGKRHREDGPAIEWASGIRKWYLNSKSMTEEQHRIAVSEI